MKSLLVLLTTLILIGCAGAPSGYDTYYVPKKVGEVISSCKSNRLPPPTEVVDDQSLMGRNNEIKSQGFRVLGYSSFVGSYEDFMNATNKGRKIGADYVLIMSPIFNDSRNVSYSYLYSDPDIVINNTYSGNGAVVTGNGVGVYGYQGNSQTRIPGQYHVGTAVRTIDRYRQTAVYYADTSTKCPVPTSVSEPTQEDSAPATCGNVCALWITGVTIAGILALSQ